jgi:hypothetical protein
MKMTIDSYQSKRRSKPKGNKENPQLHLKHSTLDKISSDQLEFHFQVFLIYNILEILQSGEKEHIQTNSNFGRYSN